VPEYLAGKRFDLRRAGDHYKVACPFHEEKTPSFAVYDDHAHCYGCDWNGDVIRLEQELTGKAFPAACEALGGVATVARYADPAAEEKRRERARREREEARRKEQAKKAIAWPDDIRRGSEAEWRELAALRSFTFEGVLLAVDFGILRFGTVMGLPSWIVTDASKRCAEARRMDGKRYFLKGNWIKSYTLPGSRKSWPVGIQPSPKFKHFDKIRKMVVVEGMPDLIDCYSRVFDGNADALPVAMLGRGNRIHEDALPRFRGRHVRIMPHADEDGGGREAAERWAKQIRDAGAATVDGFDFSGLTRKDGKPVNDLNDCRNIRHEDESELERILP